MNRQTISLSVYLLLLSSLVSCAGGFNSSRVESSSSPLYITTTAGENLTSYSITLVSSMGETISNATVSLTDNENNTVSGGKVNQNGTYTASVPNGEYKVNVSDMDSHYYLDNNDIRISDTDPSIVITVRSKADSSTHYVKGDTLYDYCFTDALSKETYYLSDLLKNEKNQFIVINLWYVTCAPCKEEFNALESVYEKYKDKMEVIALTYDSESKVKKYKDENGFTFYMGNDPDSEMINAINNLYFPAVMFVEKSGRIDYYSEGLVFDTSEKWEKAFEHYLSEDYASSTFSEAIINA